MVDKRHKKPRISTPEDGQDVPEMEHQDLEMSGHASSQDRHLRREEVSIHAEDQDQAHLTLSSLEEENANVE